MMSSRPSICFFIINLDNATDRLNFVSSQLERFDIPWKRISAVDGSKLKPPYINYQETKFNIFFGKETNPNVVAVFYSHLKAMRCFLESEYDIGIILEDDACISNNFNVYIDDIIKTSDRWDLLRLSATRKSIFFNRNLLKSGNILATHLTMLKGLCCYAINRKGAKRLVDNLIPFYLPVDIAIENEWLLKIKSRCLIPFPVQDAIAYKKTEVLKSQIPRGAKISYFRFTAKMHNFIQKTFRIIYRIITSGINHKR